MGDHLNTNSKAKFVMSSPTYDVLKFVALVILPATNTLWLGLGQVWNLPYVTEIATTIALVDAFLGAALKLSNNAYQKQNPAPPA